MAAGKPHRFTLQKVSGGTDNTGIGLFVGTLGGYSLSPTVPWWFVPEDEAHRFSDRIAAQSAAEEIAQLGHKTELVSIPVRGHDLTEVKRLLDDLESCREMEATGSAIGEHATKELNHWLNDTDRAVDAELYDRVQTACVNYEKGRG